MTPPTEGPGDVSLLCADLARPLGQVVGVVPSLARSGVGPLPYEMKRFESSQLSTPAVLRRRFLKDKTLWDTKTPKQPLPVPAIPFPRLQRIFTRVSTPF